MNQDNNHMPDGVASGRKIHILLLFILVGSLVCAYLLWNFLSQSEYYDQAKDTQLQEEVAASSDLPSSATVEDQGPELKDGAVPLKEASEQEQGKEHKASIFNGVVRAGDSASTLLNEWIGLTEINAMSEASKSVFPLHKLRLGQPYSVYLGEDGFERFEYEIDSLRKLVLSQDTPTSFSARIEKIPYETLLVNVEASIDSSLFQSIADLGESPMLAVKLADIFAWEINFIKDIRQGDKFTVLVEKYFRNGEFKRYGRVLAASFVNQGKRYEAFLFNDANGVADYFTESGESIKRAFLQAPLSFTRISSGFTRNRFHPVLKEWRAHPAIDYAAPTGTPVKAVGNGVVTYSGWGNGAGNYIALRHNNGYETMYLHLSGFASGLKKGSKVSQGEVIGFVGSTGYSTGSHLDFRMKKDGSFINPISAMNPRAESLTKEALPAFHERLALYRSFLGGEKSLMEYTPLEDAE